MSKKDYDGPKLETHGNVNKITKAAGGNPTKGGGGTDSTMSKPPGQG